MHPAFGFYLITAASLLFTYGLMMFLAETEEQRRFGARMFTLAPVWPVALAVALIWLVIKGARALVTYVYKTGWAKA